MTPKHHTSFAVKKLFAWGLVFLCALQAFGQSNVLMQLSEANAYPTTNRPITIQATSPFFGNKVFIYSDTNGNALYNFNPGVLYNCQITAPPQAINFQIYVPPGTVGTAIDWTNFWGIGGGIATYPAGAVAPSIAMADARYLMSGTSLTNLYYPLTNPNGFVSNSVLLAASNGIIALIPGTNGFISYSITNQYWPSNYVGSTFAYESSLLATGTTLAASIVAATNAPWIVNTNQLLTRQLGSATLTNLSGVTTNQIAFTNSPYFDPAGTAQAATNAAGQASGLLAYQPTNILSQYETTNGFANGTNTIYGVIYSQIAASNSTVNAYATNVFQVLSNYTTFASNTVQFSKQPASAILSNAVVTGINTNGYAAGVGAYLTTNTPGTIQSINVSNQTFLTNQMTPIVYEPLGFYLGSNSLPALTNGFTTQFNSTNGYWPSNYVGSTFYPTSNPSGFTTQFLATNSYWPSNYVGLNFYPTSNPSGFSTQAQLTNFYMLGTNYANTNAQSLFQQSTNYANTNSSPYYVAATNGTATGLTIQSNLSIGTKTAWLYSTNDFGIDGPCGSPYVVGTYWGIPYGSVWTNNFYPWQTMVISAGVFYLQSNNVTLYSSANGQTWTVTPPGIAPAPVGHYGYDILNNGANYKGWIFGTNLTAQINGATVGGVVQGILSDEFFSAAATNVIANLIAQLASTNSGASLNQVTDVISSFQFVSSNGATANGQQVYSTNTGLGWFWAAASSGGGNSQAATNGMNQSSGLMAFQLTNNWATYNALTNINDITSNGLAGQIAAGGIATLGGLGTNTSLTNFNYLLGTNIYSATNRSVVASATTAFDTNLYSVNAWSSNSTSTNVLAQSGYIGNEFDTNLTVVNDTWLGNSNMLIYYLPSVALIPFMTASNMPSGLATASTNQSSADAFYAFQGGGDGWISSVGATTNLWLQYKFPSPTTIAQVVATVQFFSGTANTNIFQFSSDGITWTPLFTNLLGNSLPNIYFTNTFPPITYQYYRWIFPAANASIEVIGAQFYYPLPENIISNTPAVEIISADGVMINTNNAGTNALEVFGNIDSTVGFTINGAPLNGASSSTTVYNQLLVTGGNPANIDGVYTLNGQTSVYTNGLGGYLMPPTTYSYSMSGLSPVPSEFLLLTNPISGSSGNTNNGNTTFYPAFINPTLFGYYRQYTITGTGYPFVQVYYASNNVPSGALASGPGGNYDGSLVTNISNLAIANSGAITNTFYPNGMVDQTAYMQTVLNRGGNIYFTPGDYYADNLFITNNTKIYGNNATLHFIAGNTNFSLCIWTNVIGVTIQDLNVDGGASAIPWEATGTYRTVFQTNGNDLPNYPMYAAFNGFTNSCGIFVGSGQVALDNVNISGFAGYGILLCDTNDMLSQEFRRAQLNKVTVVRDYIGLWTTTWNYDFVPFYGTSAETGYNAEYAKLNGVSASRCTIGIGASAGNVMVDGVQSVNNYIGVYCGPGSGNGEHSFIQNCTLNHNQWGIECSSVSSGEFIFDNTFLSNYQGEFYIDASEGIDLEGNRFGSGTSAIFTNSTGVGSPGLNWFVNNVYLTSWSSLNLQTNGTGMTVYIWGNHNNVGGNDGLFIQSNNVPYMSIGGIPVFPVNSNSIVQWTNGSAIGTTIYGSPGQTNWTTFGPLYDTRTNTGTATSETIGGNGFTVNTSNLVNTVRYGITSNGMVIYVSTNVLFAPTNGGSITWNGVALGSGGGGTTGLTNNQVGNVNFTNSLSVSNISFPTGGSDASPAIAFPSGIFGLYQGTGGVGNFLSIEYGGGDQAWFLNNSLVVGSGYTFGWQAAGLSSSVNPDTTMKRGGAGIVQFNGVASVASGVSSQAAGKLATMTVGTSPFSFTNTGTAALECYFTGATAYSISKNGVAIYGSLAGNDYVLVQPTNVWTLTYTVAPTVTTNTW